MSDLNLFTVGLEVAKFYGVEFEYSQTFMDTYRQSGQALESFVMACNEWDLPISPELRAQWDEDQAEKVETEDGDGDV